MVKDLENKVYDPFNLLDKEFNSSHHNGLKAKVIMYDHTGAILTKCECGVLYWHDQGVYKN